jgi:hypothetical protein
MGKCSFLVGYFFILFRTCIKSERIIRFVKCILLVFLVLTSIAKCIKRLGVI